MTGDGSELSVLVVDDDAAILRTLLLTLKSLGCRAVGESGGEAALAAVEKQAPDLLLTDMRMEGMSGVETRFSRASAPLQSLVGRYG